MSGSNDNVQKMIQDILDIKTEKTFTYNPEAVSTGTVGVIIDPIKKCGGFNVEGGIAGINKKVCYDPDSGKISAELGGHFKIAKGKTEFAYSENNDGDKTTSITIEAVSYTHLTLPTTPYV